jgi:hypothetical protein
MSGGKEGQKTNQISQDHASAGQEHNQFLNTVNQGIAGPTGRAADMYGTQYTVQGFAEGK